MHNYSPTHLRYYFPPHKHPSLSPSCPYLRFMLARPPLPLAPRHRHIHLFHLTNHRLLPLLQKVPPSAAAALPTTATTAPAFYNRFVHSKIPPTVHHPSIFEESPTNSNDTMASAHIPHPELPQPAHLDRDSALGRKFGREVTNYFGGELQNNRLWCDAVGYSIIGGCTNR